jgi:hypothetical protein
VKYDSLTLGAKGFQHFPSFSQENSFKSHLIELEKGNYMIQITKMKTLEKMNGITNYCWGREDVEKLMEAKNVWYKL